MAPSISSEVDGEVSWRLLLDNDPAKAATLALAVGSCRWCGGSAVVAAFWAGGRAGLAGGPQVLGRVCHSGGVWRRGRSSTVPRRSHLLPAPRPSTTGLSRPSTGGLTCTGSSTRGAWRGSFKVDGRGLVLPLEIGSVGCWSWAACSDRHGGMARSRCGLSDSAVADVPSRGMRQRHGFAPHFEPAGRCS